MANRTVLLLAGSPGSTFYQELSELYARGCLDALSEKREEGNAYTFIIAHVSTGGLWRFPSSLDALDIASSDTMNLAQALERIASVKIDIALPQMFCSSGMTHYRALLELLDLPYLGNRPLQMALTADKSKTKAIVESSGIRVPDSELLSRGQKGSLGLPMIVKPNDADNSEGVTLVRHANEYAEAVERAHSLSTQIIVEQYIEAGREVRCAVVEIDGLLQCLPIEEYFLDSADRPIRALNHKLAKAGDEGLTLTSKTAKESWIVANDDPIVELVHEAALVCHVALGCRQYSLFDFRIDPHGMPWFLEAGLYCSFSPQSVIVTMMEATGTSLPDFFDNAINSLVKPAI